MTTELRTSQVEVLRLAVELQDKYGPFESGDLAWKLSIQTSSAARHLKGLVASGHMQVERSGPTRRRFYSLTELGHEALEGEG